MRTPYFKAFVEAARQRAPLILIAGWVPVGAFVQFYVLLEPRGQKHGASERDQQAGGAPHPRDSRQAEQAVRVLLQWAGEDPDARRAARHADARRTCVSRLVFRLSQRSGRLPAAHLRRSRRLRRDDRAARDRVRVALRASHGADHRPRARRLPADQQGRRHQQARARRRRLCAPLPGAGEADGADRELHRDRAASPAASASSSMPLISA